MTPNKFNKTVQHNKQIIAFQLRIVQISFCLWSALRQSPVLRQVATDMKQFIDGRVASEDYNHCMKIIKKAFVDHGMDNAFNDYHIYSPIHYWDKDRPAQPNSAACPYNIV